MSIDIEILITAGKAVGAIVTLAGAIKYIPMGWRWLRSRLGKKQQASAKLSDITITQLTGHGDNIQTVYRSTDSWLVLIRDITVVNNTERDEVVSLRLWWPLNNGAVTFTPQKEHPQKIPRTRLLKRVENIAARESITGSLLFKLPRSTVPEISDPFFILIVTSQLTGRECAFNSLSFTEVKKPYPLTLDELR